MTARQEIAGYEPGRFNVLVEYHGQPWGNITVNAKSPILACEAAERMAAVKHDHSLDNLSAFFAYSAIRA